MPASLTICSALARASASILSDSALAVAVRRSAVSWARLSTRAALRACSSLVPVGAGLTGSGSGS
ncbi:hypothetical protein BZL30_5914 [Mycobacterium kansasii]|uniref:Uncharacterized protein n=1 Tax=Mycobacterium kansasii TaxID=1768 RepID=A0A1V3WYB9_MYCKA|nr:hypothetical protein BZL30_5914 [Mycobacterium kansasii]